MDYQVGPTMSVRNVHLIHGSEYIGSYPTLTYAWALGQKGKPLLLLAIVGRASLIKGPN